MSPRLPRSSILFPVVAAAGLASACGAGVVYRLANLAVPANQAGLWLNVETGAVSTTLTPPAGWDFNIYTSGAYTSGPAAGGANIIFYTGSTNGSGFMRYPGTTSGTPPRLPVDTTVAAYGSFGAGTATFGFQEGAWKLGADNIVGFKFIGADGQLRFGWARFAVGATSTERTLVDYAYESTPAACIRTGALNGAPPPDCVSPPPYNPCAAGPFACTVGENLPVVNVTTTGSLDLSSSCGSGFVIYRANWYPFDPPSSGAFTVSLCGSAADTRLAVFSACDSGAAVLGCNDNFCSAAAAVTFTATAGQRVWLVAGGATATTVLPTFLPVSIAAPFDPCASIVAVGLGSTAVPAVTAVPALDMTGHCSPGTVYAPVIHKANYARWTAPQSRYYAFGVCPGTFAPHVAVMTQCGDPSSVLACSYDKCLATNGAKVGFWATAGTEYFLAFGTREATTALPGSVTITVQEEAPPPDPCGADLGQIALGMHSIRLDMDFPDLSMAGTPCSFANGQARLFYPHFFRFVAPSSGLYSMGNCSDTDPNFWGIYDLRLAVMSQCGDVSTLLACDDNGCNGDVPPWTSRISGLRLSAGQTVYIAVAGGDFVAPGPFAFELTLDEVFACPGDLDGDGTVGGADLGRLLGQWGPCGAGQCSADLDGSGAVDGVDLGRLLGAWGACAP